MPHKTIQSQLHGPLEINYENGKKILDTERSNYSFGSLQTILKKGLLAIQFPQNIEGILVLGMGVGSVAHTIRKDFGSNCAIEFVEFDPLLIELAYTEFDLNELQNIQVTCQDAFTFMQENKKKFDLLIVDLFIGDTIPEKFISEEFIVLLTKGLNKGSKLIFNTMQSTLEESKFTSLVGSLKNQKMELQILSKVGHTNNLILGIKN